MRKFVYAALIIFSCTSTVRGQYNLGTATSNWSPINSMYLNPASIADCRERFVLDLFMVNAGLDNSLGSLNDKGGLIGAINGGKTKNLFEYSDRSTFSLLAPYVDVRGPGFMLSINPKHSIAVTTRMRGMNQLNNFDQTFYKTISDPTYTANGNYDFTSKNFNYTAHLWTELGFSYGAVLLDKGNNLLKAGITVRYLGGVGYIGLKGNNLDAHYSQGADSFYASNTDLAFASNLLSTRSAISNGLTNNSILSQFFGDKAGSGLGGDIGLVYEFIDNPAKYKYNLNGPNGLIDHTQNRYKWRLSASITDMGSIKYKSDDNSIANVRGSGYLTGHGISENVTAFDEFRGYAARQGFSADTDRVDTRVYMPSKLVLGIDYHVWRGIYANVTYIGSMANARKFGNTAYNQITLTPRIDSRKFSIAVPLTYSMLSSSIKAGAALRFSGFCFGSDDMLALFASGQYGFNFYLGGSIPIQKSKPKDSDGDGVADGQDKCPKNMGTWENRGCPDNSADEADDDDDAKKGDH